MTPTRPRTRPGIAAAGVVLATATAATAGWAQRSPASTPIVVSPLAMACETNALGLDALKRATNRQNLKARNEVEAKLQAAADTAAPDSADRVLDFARCELRLRRWAAATIALGRARTLVEQQRAAAASQPIATSDGIPRAGRDVPRPAATVTVPLAYDYYARLRGIAGMVVVDALIDATGHVSDARVAASVPGLDEAALAAVRQRVFAPTIVSGSPTPVRMTIAARFGDGPEMTDVDRVDLARAEYLLGDFDDAIATLGPAVADASEQSKPHSPSTATALRPPKTREGFAYPTVSKRVSPQYTPYTKTLGVEGVVRVNAIVGEDGTIGDAWIVKSLEPDLDDQALTAARQWLFTPATQEGQPLAVLVTIALEFKLH